MDEWNHFGSSSDKADSSTEQERVICCVVHGQCWVPSWEAKVESTAISGLYSIVASALWITARWPRSQVHTVGERQASFCSRPKFTNRLLVVILLYTAHCISVTIMHATYAHWSKFWTLQEIWGQAENKAHPDELQLARLVPHENTKLRHA